MREAVGLSLLALSLVAPACCPPPPPPTEVVLPATPAQQMAQQGRCREQPLALQILGSGGPVPDDGRASAGYVLWHEGKSRLLIDAGGGVFLRFGQAKARIADLDAVLLTHLHADHAGDLPALLKGGYFAERKRPLPVVGPAGGERFPATDVFVEGLLDANTGAFRYLSGYLDGRLFELPTTVVDPQKPPVTVFSSEGLTVEAVGVRHGTIPALGYIVSLGSFRVAFTGDQSAESTVFVERARGADILVAHHAIPEEGSGVEHLHRTPSQIAQMAHDAAVKSLVLSHHMKRSLDDLMGSLELMRSIYAGPVDVGEDLGCYPLALPPAP